MARFEVRGTARTPGIPREARYVRHAPRARGRVRRRSRAPVMAPLGATREPEGRVCAAGVRVCAAGLRASCGACAVFPAACAAVVSGFWGVGGGWSDKSDGDDGAMSRAMARAREETPGTRRRRGRGSARRRGCGARAGRETLPPGCRVASRDAGRGESSRERKKTASRTHARSRCLRLPIARAGLLVRQFGFPRFFRMSPGRRSHTHRRIGHARVLTIFLTEAAS